MGRRSVSHDFVLLEAFHGGGVVAEDLGHEHHVGEGEHDHLVEPAMHLVGGEAGEVVGDGGARLGGVALGHAAFEALVDHQVEILAPAVGVSAGYDDGGCLFDLALVVGGGAEAFFLFFGLDDDEAPGLDVVAAGCGEAGFENFAQIVWRDGCAVEAGGGAAILNRLAQ